MYNWKITVNNPVLTQNMKFLVRYRKLPDGKWVDHLPSPTTNTFIIPGIEEAKYQAEIRVKCENGTISTPKMIDFECGKIIVDDNNSVPKITINWDNGKENASCDLKGKTRCEQNITSSDLKDFVLVHLERSKDGVNFETVTVVDSQNQLISENFAGSYSYRYKGTLPDNKSVYSNTIYFLVLQSFDYVCEEVVLRNTNPWVEVCRCSRENNDCNSYCPSGEFDYYEYQEPQTVTWIDCDTGREMSYTLKEGETITVNRRK